MKPTTSKRCSCARTHRLVGSCRYCRSRSFLPELELLETRLPLGDALGMLLGTAWLGSSLPDLDHDFLATEGARTERLWVNHRQEESSRSGPSLGTLGRSHDNSWQEQEVEAQAVRPHHLISQVLAGSDSDDLFQQDWTKPLVNADDLFASVSAVLGQPSSPSRGAEAQEIGSLGGGGIATPDSGGAAIGHSASQPAGTSVEQGPLVRTQSASVAGLDTVAVLLNTGGLVLSSAPGSGVRKVALRGVGGPALASSSFRTQTAEKPFFSPQSQDGIFGPDWRARLIQRMFSPPALGVGEVPPPPSASSPPSVPPPPLAFGPPSSTIDRSQLVNVDALVQVQYSGIFHNPVTRQSTVNVRVTNISTTAISTPLIFVVENISEPTVAVANGDGTTTPDGRPFYDLTGQVPGDTLDPGETSNNRPLVFSNPNLRPFSIQASVNRLVTTPTPQPVTIEVLADPLGRRFIGVGDGLDITLRTTGPDGTFVLGQRAAAPGSRGRVFFGATGTEETATVTTVGGVAQIRVQGDFDRPSAFQGDLFLTASVGGVEVAREQVTVLKITLDRPLETRPNDMTVLRTLTSIPATPDLNIDFRFFPAIMQGDILVGRAAPTALRVRVIPLGGAPTVRTGPNGTVQFLMQSGPAGQGWTVGEAFVVNSPLITNGTMTPADFDKGQNQDCEC